MIEFEGREYVVDDATTNAYNLLNYINDYLAENNIRNKKGEVVKLKINLGSPLWLIIFGIGYITSVVQKMLFSVANAFSVNSCSDQQVLNLAQIARVDRKQGSYSSMVLRVTATPDAACTITPDNTITVTYEGVEYVFSPVVTTVIAAGQTDSINTVADKIGPVYITSASVTEFDEEVPNVATVTNLGALPGTTIESISSLRTRIMQNETITPINAVISALNSLTGITNANMYYNESNTDTVTVAGKSVPPRTAILFIQGANDDIAETYYNYMSAPTVETNAVTQSYTAANGQSFSVGYFQPEAVSIYIKVYMNTDLPTAQYEDIKALFAKQSNSLPMGSDYSQAYLLDLITDSDYYQYIDGIQLSSNGTTWSNKVVLDYNNVGVISSDNISIEEVNNG